MKLDSGCCDHVLDHSDTPGYACVLGPSVGSKKGRNFIVGNCEGLPTRGLILVNMEAEDAFAIKSTFQVAGMSRSLMRVSKSFDQGLICNFDEKEARVTNQECEVVATFKRNGCLYTCQMKLKRRVSFAVLDR